MVWGVVRRIMDVEGGGAAVASTLIKLVGGPTYPIRWPIYSRLGLVRAAIKFQKATKWAESQGLDGIVDIYNTPPPPGNIRRAAYIHSPIGLGTWWSKMASDVWGPARWSRYWLLHWMGGRHIGGCICITNSQWLAKYVELHDPASVTVVNPPCRVDVPDPPSEGRAKQAISIGRLMLDKGHDRSARICKAAGYPCHVYGRGQVPSDHYGLVPSAIRPNMPYDAIYEASRQAKAFVSGCYTEDFGISCVEAVANGCIPVVPDRLGFRETVPCDDLRYADEAEAACILKDVMDGVYDYTMPKLRQHVLQYTPERFADGIRRALGV